MSAKVTVTGADETIAYLNRIGNEIESRVAIPTMRDWATELRAAMIKREHYRSGRMRAMTKVNTVGKYWSVIVDVPYAAKENERRGSKRGKKGGGQGTPHKFVEPSMKEVEKGQIQNFITRLQQLLEFG